MINWEERYHLAVAEYDISTSFRKDTRANILVHHLEIQQEENNHRFQAILGQPGLPNASDLHSFVDVQRHHTTDLLATIVCKAQQIQLLDVGQDDFQIIAGVYVENDRPPILYLDEQSVIFSPSSSQQHSIMAMEFFAGGFGGWKMAAQFLKHYHQVPIVRTLALDFDSRALQNWVMNFGGHYVETMVDIPWQIVELFQDNIAVVGDIHSHHWKQASAVFAPNLATISAPCVSWSGANSQKGLFSEGGLVLVASLLHCKFLRPRTILLEQGRNFESHPHYSIVMKLIKAIGYRIVFQKVLDAGDTAPMQRQRWIAIACDTLSKHPFDLKDFPPKWLGDLYQTPMSFGCMVNLSEEQKSSLRLPEKVMKKYFDQRYAPPCMKNNLSGKRSTKIFQKMPTLMASYGKQHEFSERELTTHGLYGHFQVESYASSNATQLRLWHPLELAIMFIPVDTVVISKQNDVAWQHLGNAITTNHACFAFVASLTLLLKDPEQITTRDALISLLEKRLQVNNSVIIDMGNWWVITLPHHVEAETARIRHFSQTIHKEVGAIPTATFYHSDKGVLSFAQVRAIWEAQQQIPSKLDEPIPPEFAISPTIRDWITLRVIIGETTFDGAKIQPMVAVEQILGLWNFKAAVVPIEASELREDPSTHFQQLHLGKQSPELPDDDFQIILIYHSQQAWIFRIRNEEATTIATELPSSTGYYNALQQVSLENLPKTDMVLYQALPSTQDIQADPCQMMYLIPTITCHIYPRIVDDALIILVDIPRDVPDHDGCLWKFWSKALPNQWLDQHGRQVKIQERPKAIEIQLYPNKQLIPLPIPDTVEVVMFQALRQFFHLMSQHTTPPFVEIRLKWNGNALWHGILPSSTMIVWMRTTIRCFTDPITGNKDISFVAFGKRADDFTPLQTLRDSHPTTKTTGMMLAIVPELSGGGPTKMHWDVQIKNQLASALLPLGIPVEQIAPMAEAILHSVGRSKLQQILKQSPSKDQKQQLQEMAEKAGFSIAAFQKNYPKPQPLLKKPRADQMKQELRDMDFDGVQLEPGFFFDDQNDAIRQIDRMLPKTSGIMITKQQHIQEWLNSTSTISPDPLGAFIIGAQTLDTPLKQQTVLVPARTKQGQPLLLSGTLVQFGERSILYSPQHDTEGFTCQAETQVVSLTAWKDEMALDNWNELLRRPLVTLQHAFSEQGPVAPFLSTWGVSYQFKGKPSEKQQADSIQIHASLPKDKLPDLLRKSGIQGIYATPKTQNGLPDQEWKIVWLPCPIRTPGTREEALRLLSKLTQPYGLVRNKVAYGIRVHSQQYEESWTLLKPDEPVPATVANKTVYKVTPLPFGCPPESVKQWLKHIGWDAILVRPVGPKSWLIAAENEPPAQFHTFNGTPTLIRKLPAKDTISQPAIVAGPKLLHATANHDAMQQSNHDPWASYKPLTIAHSSSSSTKTTEPSVGIVQKQLQKQDDKIQSLTEEMAQLKAQQHSSQQEVQKQIKSVEATVDQTKVAFTSQMDRMKKDLENTFQQALNSQNSHIATGFEELKQMFMQTRGNPNRRTREEMEKGEDHDM